MKALELANLTQHQLAFDLEDGRLVLVEVIPTAIEGLHDTWQLQGRAWQINEGGDRFVDEQGAAVITPAKHRVVTLDHGERLEDHQADAALTLLEQFRQHALLRAAFAKKARLLPTDPDQDRF